MPSNQNIDPFQYNAPSGIQTMFTSGTLTANVSIIESTGGQLQGTQGSLGNIEGASYSGTVGAFPEVFSNNVIVSGNITVSNQTIIATAFMSGTTNAGLVITSAGQSGGGVINSGTLATQTSTVIVAGSGFGVSAVAAASGGGINAPMGFFWINVPTSGSPWVKVPFYNS